MGSDDEELRPAEYLMQKLFAEFVQLTSKKIEQILNDPLEKLLSKSLQKGEDPALDQVISALGSVAEHCLPSILRVLFEWRERQLTMSASVTDMRVKTSSDSQSKASGKMVAEATEKVDHMYLVDKRDLAIEFIFCLVLIEVLKQLQLHPGHDDLLGSIESLAFTNFKFREGIQGDPNLQNMNIIADLYAEVIGVIVQSRFSSIRKRFMNELKDLRSKEPSPLVTHEIISLLMGMKFFRIKMVPIEEFEASFSFMHECASYFLEVKDKDIKHALAGLFVEILVPVAAVVKNEVNVPCLKNFVELLYPATLDLCTKKKHMLALFPLITCLLCVSQKSFFLQNWHTFLVMCLSHLKNRDPKMSRVALESLYRLLWVYMIRIKCESNTATSSRLQSIVNSLFPKGSKAVVPRDTPLNIFVKIIQFIAQERLDFAMKEIVFDLLSVGRPIKMILTPERMSIGLRAFLVVADSLQQKEGEPPMPRTVGALPSGNTVRIKKTYLSKMLTDEMARNIGMNHYYPYVKKALNDILRALDSQSGRPLMMTTVQNMNKEPDDMITGERKPKIDLFRTCIAAIPRLIPDGMSKSDLIDLLARMTVHMDEEMRALSFQSLQNIVNDFPTWRDDVLDSFVNFIQQDITDNHPTLVDNALRMLIGLLNSYKNTLQANPCANETRSKTIMQRIEGLALVMLCSGRSQCRRLASLILKDIRNVRFILNYADDELPVIDIIDRSCVNALDSSLSSIPSNERPAINFNSNNIDLQWLVEKSSTSWATSQEETSPTKNSSQDLLKDEYRLNIWLYCLMFLVKEVSRHCPSASRYAWVIVYHRMGPVYSQIEATTAAISYRASVLLQGNSSAPRKNPGERESALSLWRTYLMFACTLAPSSYSIGSKSELDASYSPDNLFSNEKTSDVRLPSKSVATPSLLFSQVLQFMRHEQHDIRSAVILGLSFVNDGAVRDLLEELVQYIRETIDRRQENMRRKKRRDLLRSQIGHLFELMAARSTFGSNPAVLDKETGSLSNIFLEYLDGTRLCLEQETDKDIAGEAKEIFCNFVYHLIESFQVEYRANLMSRELRKNLFWAFSSWSGPFKKYLTRKSNAPADEVLDFTSVELTALRATCSVLSCGPVFDCPLLAEEGTIYDWLLVLLSSRDERIAELAQQTLVLLLDFNSDIGTLLDWVVECCYTKPVQVADNCFTALATLFCLKEYPCDHYISIINLALTNIGSPRSQIHNIAVQLLQVLDRRFFDDGSKKVLDLTCRHDNLHNETDHSNELEFPVQLRNKSASDKNQLNVQKLCENGRWQQPDTSRRMAQLYPHLTMPIFSEVTHRFQTARPPVRWILLENLIPWLENSVALVDPHVNASPEEVTHDTEGWGSAEATEMILNNVFYMTALFGDEYTDGIEKVWAALCVKYPHNVKIIIRYLFIMTAIAPSELMSHTKRVACFLARSATEKFMDEIVSELQSVESLNCLIERTETPPFYRLTALRKSLHSEEDSNSAATTSGEGKSSVINLEEGTLHTKRHSTENGQTRKSLQVNSMTAGEHASPAGAEKSSGDSTSSNDCKMEKESTPNPHPPPMPEFGGYYAPLTKFLPSSSQPVIAVHRCNLALTLLTDVILDDNVIDWSPHLPVILHIVFLGLDHSRNFLSSQCKLVLLNLLLKCAENQDTMLVIRTLIAREKLPGCALVVPPLMDVYNFLEPNACRLPSVYANPSRASSRKCEARSAHLFKCPSEQVIHESHEKQFTSQFVDIHELLQCLIEFLVSVKSATLWSCEDITARVWAIRSAEQLTYFLNHVAFVFKEFFPDARIEERWAEIALQLALSCSSRHYAGRSLQIFRALKMPINSRTLADILSRLVETVSEQGEDMQGYVTELMLTLESAVSTVYTNQSNPLAANDLMVTSNYNTLSTRRSAPPLVTIDDTCDVTNNSGNIKQLVDTHVRSTSVSLAFVAKEQQTCNEICKSISRVEMNLTRSRSVQSLQGNLDTSGSVMDDRNCLLAKFFWIAIAMLETDYEHEFLLAVRLLEQTLIVFPLEKSDCLMQAEKLFHQIKWPHFPGIHALLLKGCTSPLTYEATIALLHRLTPLLDISIIDPSDAANAFPATVMALLPYMLANYDDPSPLCIEAAGAFATWSCQRSTKMENLSTVMSLYSRRSFSKESFQWTKCVVKYLYDAYAGVFQELTSFLVEIADKGPVQLSGHVLSIVYCIFHYIQVDSFNSSLNSELAKLISKYMESQQWKEALKIVKLVVSRSSSLAAAPSASQAAYINSTSIDCLSIASVTSSYADADSSGKRELPGRTMEFTYDVTKCPIIAEGLLHQASICSAAQVDTSVEAGNSASCDTGTHRASSASAASMSKVERELTSSPKKSFSHHPSFNESCGGNWRRPWFSQARTRERLVSLLTSFGQRVGLPKSPSVIFSQSSEVLEKQSSVASSTEDVSAANNEASSESKVDDTAANEFGLFKDFDFLEYELESQDSDGMDNFNWGVRRRSLSNLEEGAEDLYSCSPQAEEVVNLRTTRETDDLTSDEEGGSVSPCVSNHEARPVSGLSNTHSQSDLTLSGSPPQ